MAEMTRMMMSVTLAPLTRKLLKASWPGVSMKVISLSWSVTKVKAPIDYVIAPNSASALCECLNASSSVVFPWSTWPMIVTTGARSLITFLP